MKPDLPYIESKPTSEDRPTGRECALIAALFLAGVILRCGYPSRMAVEHFDEGVYASNFWFDRDMGYRYPDQHLYAPPLLPAMIEWIFILAGPSNLGAMLPGLVAGCLTIPLVWWIGRSWFGPTAGLAGAALCALSDPHIVFSRTALTDVLLCFWLLLAVHFFWRTLTIGGIRSTLAAGLATALAWWTKYSGWLPLAIGAAGAIPWCIACRLSAARRTAGDRRSNEFGRSQSIPPAAPRHPQPAERAEVPGLIRSLTRWGLFASIAFAAWSPWLMDLQSKGGYAAIKANHSRYLVGLEGWLESLVAQCRNLTALEGSAGQHAPHAALLVALLWSVIGDRRFTWNRVAASLPLWLVLGAVLALSAVWPGWLLAGLLGVLALMWQSFRILLNDDPRCSARFQLGFWLMAAWFVGLALTTPFYNPYPRLTLPALTAIWLAGGLGVRILLSFIEQFAGASENGTRPFAGPMLGTRLTPGVRRPLLVGTIGACLAGFAILETQVYRQGVPGWNSRTSILNAAEGIEHECRSDVARTAGPDQPYVIYTLSEPGLLFQLKLRGVDEVRPIGSLGLAGPTVPPPQLKSFVVIGSLAESQAGFGEQFSVATNRLEPLPEEHEFDPSLVVRLDSPGASDATSGRGQRLEPPPKYKLKVYELH